MISVMYSTLLILWKSESREVNTSNFGSVGQVEEGGGGRKSELLSLITH